MVLVLRPKMTSTSSRFTEHAPRSRAGLLCTLLVVCEALSPRAAVAAPVVPTAKGAYEDGLRHYNAEHYAEAAQAFERAYTLQGRALLLFNIAQCQRKMGAFERAVETYRRYLTLVGPGDPPATVEEARSYVAELEAYIARQREMAARAARPVEPTPPRPVEPTRIEPTRIEPTRVEFAPDSVASDPNREKPNNVLVSAAPSPRRPAWKSPGLWAGVGVGVVVIGVAVGLGVGLSRSQEPESTLGTYTPRYAP